MKIRRKLVLLVSLFLLGFTLLGLYSYGSLRTLCVGGPIYERIAQSKDLVSDVLPPPAYILESYLVTLQMQYAAEARADSVATMNELAEKAKSLRNDYEARHAFWDKTLPEGHLKETLLRSSYGPAREFFEARDKEFIPALLSGDVEKARMLLRTVLEPKYEAHRAQIDNVVKMANSRVAEDEKEAKSANARTMVWLVALGLGLGLGCAFLSMVVGASIRRPLGKAAEMIQELCDGKVSTRLRLSRSDEVGIIAQAMDRLADNIESVIAEVNVLFQAAVRGNLSERGDTARFQGAYKDIVAGMNKTMDSIVGYLETLPVPIWFIDRDYRIQYINDAGAKLAGKDRTELAGTRCAESFGLSTCSTPDCPCSVAMRNSGKHQCEQESTGTGTKLEVLSAAGPLQGLDGNVVGAFELIVDQTEIKTAMRARKTDQSKIEKAMLRAQKVAVFQAAETQKVVEGLNMLAAGDLNFRIQIHDGDGELTESRQMLVGVAEAVEQSKANLVRLVSGAEQLADAANEGKLSIRADASTLGGDYRKVVEGLNKTFEKLVEPVRELSRVLHQIAAGDLTARVTSHYGGDLEELKDSANTAVDQIGRLVAEISRSTTILAVASEEVKKVSQQMTSNAEETSTQAGVVSAASEQVNRSVQTVATASEEMSASVREIAKRASEAARVATSAVKLAESTHLNINKLGASSAEIGEVIKVITAIAQQTNLLALNATIEAARAGNAGKGFAVVANEVKELAKETAKATENISRKIEGIQGDTRLAVDAVNQISAVITQINDIQTSIAGAVEEQSATTSSIERNISEAAKATAEIAENISGMANAASDTAAGAEIAHSAAEDLSKMAMELNTLVGRFRI